jgi:peroxiredoxin
MSKRWLSIAGVILFLAAVFCAGFAVFYYRIQRSQAEVAESKTLINKPLPHAQLVDSQGTKVDEQVLRKGRVLLVFVATDCDACGNESKFLQPLLGRRKDVAFYGVVPFGRHPDSGAVAEKMFPFKVFYDESNSFVSRMGINRVPVKVYLEDGIIKKGWVGAALSDKAKTSFVEWLDGLP